MHRLISRLYLFLFAFRIAHRRCLRTQRANRKLRRQLADVRSNYAHMAAYAERLWYRAEREATEKKLWNHHYENARREIGRMAEAAWAGKPVLPV